MMYKNVANDKGKATHGPTDTHRYKKASDQKCEMEEADVVNAEFAVKD